MKPCFLAPCTRAPQTENFANYSVKLWPSTSPSAKTIIPVALKFLGTEVGRSCPGSEVGTRGTAQFRANTELAFGSDACDRVRGGKNKNHGDTKLSSWDTEQDPALPNGICLALQVLPNLCSPHSWSAVPCGTPQLPLGGREFQRPTLQPGSHDQTRSFTTTTPQIKVLPAPSALPQ